MSPEAPLFSTTFASAIRTSLELPRSVCENSAGFLEEQNVQTFRDCLAVSAGAQFFDCCADQEVGDEEGFRRSGARQSPDAEDLGRLVYARPRQCGEILCARSAHLLRHRSAEV